VPGKTYQMLSQTLDDLPPSSGGLAVRFKEDTPFQIDGADFPLRGRRRTGRGRWHRVVPLGARRRPVKYLWWVLAVLRRESVLGVRERRLRLQPGRRHVGNRGPRRLLLNWARRALDLYYCHNLSVLHRCRLGNGKGVIHSSLIIFLISSRDGGCCPGTPGGRAISGLPCAGP